MNITRLTGLLVALVICAGFAAQAQQIVVNGVPIGASVTQITGGAKVTVPAGGDVVGTVNYVNSQGGGVVTLEAGDYQITQSITPGSNVEIIGQGRSTVIYAPRSPNGIAMIAAPNGAVSNWVIRDLVLDGNIPRGAFLVTGTQSGNPYANSGIYLYGNNNTVNNIDLHNVEIRNTGIGILATVTNSMTFDEVYIHDNNPGNFAHNAYLVGCDFVYILHSRFDAAHTGDGLHFDFSASYYEIDKSEFVDNNGEGILDQGSTNNVIQDTILSGNTNDGINLGSNNGLITRDNASYNGGYGYDVPGSTLSDDVYGVGDGAGFGDFVDYIFQNLLLQANPTPNQYPAILATGVTGIVDTADWVTSLSTPNAYYKEAVSGYSTIGAVDFNLHHRRRGTITFPSIGSSAMGSTQVAIRYSNGSKKTPALALSVNGMRAGTVTFLPTGGWSTWAQASVSVPLNIGNNTITLAALPNATVNPLLDYLQVGEATPATPAAPTGVTVVANSPYQATVSWTPVSGAQSYVVNRTAGTGFAPVAANITGTSWTDDHLLFGNNTVSYVVSAVNQGGQGPASATVTTTTPTDAPAGLQVAPATKGYTLNWMSAYGATKYLVKRSPNTGGPYETIATVKNTTSLTSTNFEESYTDTTARPDLAYAYVVQAIGATRSANSDEVRVGLPGSLNNGPAPTTEDVGNTGLLGATAFKFDSVTPGLSLYELTAAGSGIWSTADSFRYLSFPVEGDVTLSVRVTNLRVGSPTEQAGIDIRESLAPGATNVFVGVSGGIGAESLVRPGTGAETQVAARLAGIKSPYWLKLNRTGNLFTSSISKDGTKWTVLSTATLTMANQAFIGLAAASATGEATLAQFDYLGISGGFGYQ